MALKEAQWTDAEGRQWRTLVPDDFEGDGEDGIPAGPPPLGDQGWPLAFEVRLHNELFARRLFTLEDLRRHRDAVESAIRSALRVDVEKVMALFKASESEVGNGQTKYPQAVPDPRLYPRRGRRPGNERRLSRPR